MKFYDNGCFYSVSVSASEVDDFKQSWPCSNLPEKPIWFQFDKKNGDLVDMKPSNWEERFDCGPALLALSGDAQKYGENRMKKFDTKTNK